MELKPDMGFASLIHERIFIKDILAINAFVDVSLQKKNTEPVTQRDTQFHWSNLRYVTVINFGPVFQGHSCGVSSFVVMVSSRSYLLIS